MSAAADVHARCIREDHNLTVPDAFAAEYCGPTWEVIDALQGIDLSENGGLGEITDLALNLLDFIRDQPTPALRYAALKGVVFHLVEALAPKPTTEAAP